MPNDTTKRRPDEDEEDDPQLDDDTVDEPAWEEGDPADRRRDPLRKPQ